jgi:hypothetical protein
MAYQGDAKEILQKRNRRPIFRVIAMYRLCNSVAGPILRNAIGELQGEGREGVETAIQVLGPSVMLALRGVRRSNCKEIWRRVYYPSEGMLKLLLYIILLV